VFVIPRLGRAFARPGTLLPDIIMAEVGMMKPEEKGHTAIQEALIFLSVVTALLALS
jgi:hypothetical protein